MSRKDDSFDKAFKIVGTMVVVYILGVMGLLGFAVWAIYKIVMAIAN